MESIDKYIPTLGEKKYMSIFLFQNSWIEQDWYTTIYLTGGKF